MLLLQREREAALWNNGAGPSYPGKSEANKHRCFVAITFKYTLDEMAARSTARTNLPAFVG